LRPNLEGYEPLSDKGPTPTELRAVALFEDLSDGTVRRVLLAANPLRFTAGQHILWEQEPCRAAYFILSGEVRVYRVSMEGREQVLVRLGPGQAFNTVPVFQRDGQNPANVVALSEVNLLAIESAALRRLATENSDLALALLGDFAGRLAHLTDLVESLALHTVQERLARFLLDHASPGQQPATKQRWTQQDLALHVGTVRDVVGRALRELNDAGIIQLGRGTIVLLDRDALEDLAGR
jgi:CRP/FNR family transcriptional regulator